MCNTPCRILVALAVGTLCPVAAAQLVPGNWQKTWGAEFNGSQTDLAGWSYDLGNNNGWGNNERQVYTASSSNAYVAGGALHIAAIATGTGAGQTYTSARLKTTALFSQAWGLFEFRAKLPAGTGIWPAIWMMPKDSAYGGWPTSGEIDILESKGQSPTLVQSTLHSGPAWNQVNHQSGFYPAPAGFSTGDWHTYTMQWSRGSFNVPGTFRWYVDGTLYHTRFGGWTIPSGATPGNRDAPFDKPFYLIMNVAVGGNYVGDPSLAPGSYEMQVDYARAYRITADATGDGIVNNSDLSLLMSNFNKTVTGGYAAGDFNLDGRVSAEDLAIYDRARAGLTTPAQAPVLVVPEPTTLVVPSLLALMYRRRPARP